MLIFLLCFLYSLSLPSFSYSSSSSSSFIILLESSVSLFGIEMANIITQVAFQLNETPCSFSNPSSVMIRKQGEDNPEEDKLNRENLQQIHRQ